MLIDTHSHIYDLVFKEDWDDVLQRIREAGIDKIFLPNVDRETIPQVNDLAASDPQLLLNRDEAP